jgi:Staphylococcal nuclease homologue
LIKTERLIEHSLLPGIVFFFVFIFNISINFTYGNELNKLAPNLKYNGIIYNDSTLGHQYLISQAINQNYTNNVELVGNVTHVADGDTLDINGITVRLSLVNTPERGQPGFKEAKKFVNSMCLGKKGELDVDDGQRRGDRYGREVGVVYCNGININEKLMDNHLAKILTKYCDISEFSDEKWAKSDCSLRP